MQFIKLVLEIFTSPHIPLLDFQCDLGFDKFDNTNIKYEKSINFLIFKTKFLLFLHRKEDSS